MEQESQLVEKILNRLPFTVASPLPRLRLNSPRPKSRRAATPARTDARRGPAALRLGPGDDAAILSRLPKADLVLSCDAFIEGVHFRANAHPPESVGYKSLARATSDLAAMGAVPRYFLLTLALPKSRTVRWLDGFLKGMSRASRELGVAIIGGDTTLSPTVSISITVLGEIAPGRAVGRSGARPGDLIYVSGKLGRAQLGLELVLGGHALDPRFRAEVQPQLYPKIQVELGAWLAGKRLATAMMDISDGLSTDLSRLCSASKVGARIYANKIPRVLIQPSARKKLSRRTRDTLEMALHGGEDYALLFTVSPSLEKKLRKAPSFRNLIAIGEIIKNKTLLLIDGAGRQTPLKPLGWDPF